MKKVAQYDVTTPSALRKTLDKMNDKAEALRERVGDLEMKVKRQATKINKLVKGSTVASIILAIFMIGLLVVPANAEIPHRQKERFYNDIATEKKFDAKGTNTLSGPTTISGAATLSGNITPTGTVQSAFVGTDIVTATNIVNNIGVINFPLGATMVDGTGPILSSTGPALATVDDVAAILYDDSTEVTPVQWSFITPDDYVSTMIFYASISSSEATGTDVRIDWALTQNKDDTVFGTTRDQAVVASTSLSLDTKNDVLTLTPDATGAALFVDGAVISLEIFNASTGGDNTEIKAVWAEYIKKQ